MGRHGTNAAECIRACPDENKWCCSNGKEVNRNYPICAVDPPEPAGTCKGQEDTCPSVFLPLSRILSELQRAPDYSNFVINIGAMDGITGDPLYPALCAQPNISGIFLEGTDLFYTKLVANYARFPNAIVLKRFVSATTLHPIIMSSTPASKRNTSPDVLKLDIDSCECELLAEYLARIRSKRLLPKIIQIEVSAHLHPPLSFSERCHTQHSGVDQVKLMEQMIRERGWYTRRWSLNSQVNGCSLQAATDLLAPYGYVLLQYDWPDGVFIQENFIHLFPSIASQTYLQRWHVGLKHAEVYYKRYQNDLHYGRNGPDPRKRPAGSVEFLGAMPDFLAHATVRPAKSLEHFLEWMFTTYLHTTNTEVYESMELRFAISGTLARARAVYYGTNHSWIASIYTARSLLEADDAVYVKRPMWVHEWHIA